MSDTLISRYRYEFLANGDLNLMLGMHRPASYNACRPLQAHAVASISPTSPITLTEAAPCGILFGKEVEFQLPPCIPQCTIHTESNIRSPVTITMLRSPVEMLPSQGHLCSRARHPGLGLGPSMPPAAMVLWLGENVDLSCRLKWSLKVYELPHPGYFPNYEHSPKSNGCNHCVAVGRVPGVADRSAEM